jgi:oligopeptidase A
MSDNPLFQTNALPPFSKFSPEQVEPAIDAALERGRQAVKDILHSKERSYDAVIGQRNEAEDALSKAWGMVSHLNAVKNSDELREVYNKCLPKLSDYGTEMGQNRELYEAYKAIDPHALAQDQTASLKNSLLDFELSGVSLEGEARKRSGEISSRLSELSAKFGENVLDATMAWSKEISDENDLAGLPEDSMGLLAQNAQQREKEGYLITLDIPSYLAVMTYAEDRTLRAELYEAYATKASEMGPNGGEFDNSKLMEEMLALKQEQSKLLGFDSAAHKSLARKMAESPERVIDFLKELAQKGHAKAQSDLAELQAFAKEELGLDTLEAWDMTFVSEKLKVAKYEISQEEVRQYFPLDQVLKGMFEVVRRIFEIEVEADQGIDVWHEDVQFFKVNRQGQHIASFYLDPFARQHKRGGAWMDECRSREKTAKSLQLPVAYLVCNFPPPIGEQPSLLTHDDVTTLFHEFGHGLHLMLTEVDDPNVSGINGVAWDAVELPSQMMENWCWSEEALPLISRHHKSGEPLPQSLLKRMLDAKNFQSGMMLLRQIEFSLFDFRLHMEYGQENFRGIQALLDEVRSEVAVVTPPEFNRFQHSFSHIFAGGYSAGYYSYKWAEVLSSDAFSRFEKEGIFNVETGRRFVDAFLSKGGSKEASELFADFMGRGPSIEALLRHSGIS